MNNYYFFSGKELPEVASAYTSYSKVSYTDIISMLEGKTEMPFNFELVKLTELDNDLDESKDLSGLKVIWLDYQPNCFAWPIFSEKLKAVIDENLTGNESVDWLSCNIFGNNEKRTYYVLRFNKLLDVLDFDNTTFVNGTDHIIQPFFQK